MNRTAIRALADFIESAKFEFDMEEYHVFPKCGTAGCIGGHAAALWPEVRTDPHDDDSYSWIRTAFTKKLDVNYEIHEDLCYHTPGLDHGLNLGSVTRSMAVAALHRLAETGRVTFDRRD